MLVLDCRQDRGSFIGPAYYDASEPENVAKCQLGFPSRPGARAPAGRLRRFVLVPCSPRTVAIHHRKGEWSYQYCGQGGLSWSIPYAAGVLALGWQLRPELSGTQMRELLFRSAYVDPSGAKFINPPEFIRLVKAIPR
ncbi:hypothetical protein ACFL34_04565 [Candidatus Sumerlaeota bacterium]